MKTPRLGLSALALAILLLAPPVSAQYIFLDSNGDGVHTAADELHAVGPTVVDIWLDTGHNRDGSATVCAPEPAEPMTMFSYEVCLEASGGTLNYSAYTNRMTQMGPLYAVPASDGIKYSSGPFSVPFGAPIPPPNRYLLGTFTVSVASGTPSIGFVQFIVWPNGGSSFTGFGSTCDGTEFLNTIVLGTDWFDADGLAYGTGGGSNQSPTLAPPSDMAVPSGENAIQAITASDAEGQLLSFSKVSGPPFMFVATTNQESGTAHGEIRLAPFLSDVGSSSGTIGVSDGAAADQATFAINVTSGPNHAPYIPSISRLTVIAGEIGRLFLSAGDADGGTLRFTKSGGPAYVSLRDLASGSGGTSAAFTASPTLCDVGTATVSVSVSDGVSEASQQVGLTVLPSSALPDSTVSHYPFGGTNSLGLSVGAGDMNGDGNQDVVVASERGEVAVLLGRGDGTLSSPTSYLTPAKALALGDFDRDGDLDVAVTNIDAGVRVFLGRGDGALLPAVPYDTGTGPMGIVATDLNRDGVVDLVTCNEQSGTVSVLLGRGDGTFATRRDAPAGSRPGVLATGDFNLDGRLDIVVANRNGDIYLTALLGLGDGTFGSSVQTPGEGYALSISSGDWNWDGATDVAVSDLRNGDVRALFGRGDGSFGASTTLTGIGYPYGIAAGDLNGDGNLDLVVGDLDFGRIAVLFGDGVGFASPVYRSQMNAVGIALADLNSDGRSDIISTNNTVTVALNRFGSAARSAQSRAFVQNGHRAIPGAAGSSTLCIRLEPVQGSYTNDQMDLTSLTLASEGTGSVSEIHCVPPRKNVEADTDGNGIAEIGSFFSRRDLAALFDQVQGRSTMTAQLTGSLTDGRRFCAGVELDIVGTSHAPHASFAPNPLNPQTKLTFTTARPGPARARIFDIQGRLVRTLLDVPQLTAGNHEYSFDGRTNRGAQLASGVYFFRVESTEETIEGHLVILK